MVTPVAVVVQVHRLPMTADVPLEPVMVRVAELVKEKVYSIVLAALQTAVCPIAAAVHHSRMTADVQLVIVMVHVAGAREESDCLTEDSLEVANRLMSEVLVAVLDVPPPLPPDCLVTQAVLAAQSVGAVDRDAEAAVCCAIHAEPDMDMAEITSGRTQGRFLIRLKTQRWVPGRAKLHNTSTRTTRHVVHETS